MFHRIEDSHGEEREDANESQHVDADEAAENAAQGGAYSVGECRGSLRGLLKRRGVGCIRRGGGRQKGGRRG